MLWVLLPSSSTAAVAPLENPQQYEIPADLSGLHFYLLTVDVGNLVWDNFGHTALRVYDENSGTDTVFNWGGIDVSGGVIGFSYDFFKGIMNYRVSTYPPSLEFSNYRAQQRSVWQDKINLSNPQKARLLRRLLWNMQPENTVYAYQYFFDNCSTRPRDYLDEALSGKISSQYTGVAQRSFRDVVRSHYESVSLVGFSLDILVNSNIDRPMTEWEEMFLPLSLRENLLSIRSDVAENGERLMLLSDSQMILEFEPPVTQTSGFRIASLTLLIPVLFLFLMLKKLPMSYYATHSRIGFKAAELNFRILGLLGFLVALFSGVYGILMLGSWFVSDHLDLHHNVNLLLFWPTDILGAMVSLRWLFACKPWPTTNNTAPFLNYYFLAHLLGLLAYCVIFFFGLSAQALGNIVFYIVPGLLAFTFLVWLVGFEPTKPKNQFF